jgi:1-acyl-sn-glycerol-3-phosphate acyltransferase
VLFKILRPIAWLLIHAIYGVCGGIRFEGRENVPRRGGVLITPNHISDFDPPTVGIALPRACYFMAKSELFDIRIGGTLIRLLHGFPVKRYSADRAALRTAEQLLDKGECVVIFPEGKLSEDGKLQPLLPGVLLVARHANVPIVPTIIEGSDRVMPYGTLKPRRAHQRTLVRFGPPVTVDQLTGGGKGGDALKRGADRLHELLLALQQNKPYPPFSPEPEPEPEAEPPSPNDDLETSARR